jgi:hypothetical protein
MQRLYARMVIGVKARAVAVEWSLAINGAPATGGLLFDGTCAIRAHPLDVAAGSGGPSVLEVSHQ